MKNSATCLFFLGLLAFLLISGCQSDKKPPSPGDTFTNSIGMKFILIPAGTFMMGSPADEPMRKPDETQHKVTISKPFFLQTTEVTQEVWKQIMGHNPSVFKNCGENCPVSMISWIESQEFIKRLNALEKTDKYRLPYRGRMGICLSCGHHDSVLSGKLHFNRSGELSWKTPHAWLS